MTRRCVVLLLAEPVWAPPGIAPDDWRRALAEDAMDLLATLAAVDVAVAATANDVGFAESVRWPDTPVMVVERATPPDVLVAAHRRGYDEAAVLACDAPDLPAMLIGKLLQPLGRRDVAVAPAGDALLGVAARLPPPPWLLESAIGFDDGGPAQLRAAAGHPGHFAVTPGWHRLRDPESLSRLDPDLEGWEATRALLSAG